MSFYWIDKTCVINADYETQEKAKIKQRNRTKKKTKSVDSLVNTEGIKHAAGTFY